MITPMKIIIAGSRNITKYSVVVRAVVHSPFAYRITEIVSGVARGADQLGERYAKDCNIPVKRFPAEWQKYGKSAGYVRNKAMAEYADGLIAVWDGESRGTQHMIQLAQDKGIPVHIERVQ